MQNRRYTLGLVALTMACLTSFPSCGSDHKLVSLSVQPAAAFFLTPNPRISIQLTALGTYVHPPETIDITNKVQWTSDILGLVTVSPQGLVTTSGTGACGVANVTATYHTNGSTSTGNVVTGTATVTVHDPTVPTCP